MWKCGYRIFIVFMNSNAPNSTLMTFDVNQFMHGQILLNSNLDGIGN